MAIEDLIAPLSMDAMIDAATYLVNQLLPDVFDFGDKFTFALMMG